MSQNPSIRRGLLFGVDQFDARSFPASEVTLGIVLGFPLLSIKKRDVLPEIKPIRSCRVPVAVRKDSAPDGAPDNSQGRKPGVSPWNRAGAISFQPHEGWQRLSPLQGLLLAWGQSVPGAFAPG
jgi:hypothetical protein